jgi:hypothetical protein
MAIFTKEATFENPEFQIFPNNLNVTDNQIQRGYMRLLSENLIDTEGRELTVTQALQHPQLGTKLNFQFNPNQLTRAVTARTDTQLWINQSPSQLLQPGIGDMNFGWSMLFNREAEVSAKEVATERRTASGLEVDSPTLDQYVGGGWQYITDNSNYDLSWERIFHGGSAEAAKVLGVLADISILDRITGQSITQESYDYAKKRLETLKTQGLAYDVAEGVGSEFHESEAMSLEDAAKGVFGEKEGVTALLEANVYNSAFLVPNPVRVVFSEHFMVDGYVNNVTVTFQKFSPEMIPTVATVDINMHAIYQGFARRESAFTTFIKLQHYLDEGDGAESDAGVETVSQNAYTNSLIGQGATGYSGGPHQALFTGFDHSPELGKKEEAATGVKEFNITRFSGIDGLDQSRNRAEVEMAEGISFSPFCYLLETALGVTISEQISGVKHVVGQTPEEMKGEATAAGNWNPYQFTARVHTGLQIRARLKTTGTTVEGKAAMGVLLDGETGMVGWGERGEVFFTDWSEGMRSDLLAVGYDNMAKSETERANIRGDFGSPTAAGGGDGQFDGSGPYYTRSFPVLANNLGAGESPQYGDQLYMHTFDLGNTHISWQSDHEGRGEERKLKGIPFAFIQQNGDSLRWGMDSDSTDPIRFNLAKGFWGGDALPWGGSGSNTDKPFISKVRIYENEKGPDTDDPNYHEFDIEYQVNLMYRVYLRQPSQKAHISDTHWLVVHSRMAPLGIIDYVEMGRGMKTRRAYEEDYPLINLSVHNTDRLDGDAVNDIWMNAGSSMNWMRLSWDGYDKDPSSGVHMWSKPGEGHPALFSANEDDGMGAPVKGAFFQKGHPDGGLFRKMGTEE